MLENRHGEQLRDLLASRHFLRHWAEKPQLKGGGGSDFLRCMNRESPRKVIAFSICPLPFNHDCCNWLAVRGGNEEVAVATARQPVAGFHHGVFDPGIMADFVTSFGRGMGAKFLGVGYHKGKHEKEDGSMSEVTLGPGSSSCNPKKDGTSKTIDGTTIAGKEHVYMPTVLRHEDLSRSHKDVSEISRSCSPSAANQEQSNDLVSTRPLPPGRDVLFFKPTAFSIWANDAVSISFVRGVEDLCDPFRQCPPLFTHQVFGPQEEIVGYEKPAFKIIYAANTLRPTLTFKYMGVVDGNQLRAVRATPTDVENLVYDRVPCDYAASVQDVISEADDTSFVPVGRLVASFDAPASSSVPRTRSGAVQGQMSRFRVYCNDLQDDASRKMLKRLQTLAIWLIERASYIAIDENWELLTMYEVYEKNGKEAYQLVGFTTMYRDHRGVKSTSSSSSAEDMQDDQAYRLRISQFVILPHFQRCGHGARLLRHVYAYARENERVTEVCVENPSDKFALLRDHTDAQIIVEMGLLDAFTCDSPAYDTLRRQLKWGRTQLRHLSQSVVRKVVIRPTDTPAGRLCNIGGADYFAGNFILVRSGRDQPMVAHVVGVNPMTGLLRVRWVYRYDELPEEQQRAFAKTCTTKHRRKSTAPQLEVFYAFHEEFLSPRTVAGKCSVFMTAHDPVSPQEHLASFGDSAFLCRFVYDPAVGSCHYFLLLPCSA
jgi:histone acetyltransferase 1